MNEDVLEVERPTPKSERILPRPPDTAGRPPTRGKDTVHTAQQSKPTTSQRDRTADEIRLLGYEKNESDPDAVPIPIPKARETKNMPSLPGGFKPKNTLNSHTCQSQAPPVVRRRNSKTTSIVSKKSIAKRTHRTLDIESIFGDNVITNPIDLSAADISSPERQPKRIKTSKMSESQEIHSVGDDSDEIDELNYLPISSRELKKSSGPMSNTPSAIAQPSGSSAAARVSQQGSPEFWGVETRMNSKNYGRQKKQNFQEPQPGKLSAAVGTPPEITEQDLMGSLFPEVHIEKEKKKYEGTARPGAKPRVKDSRNSWVTTRDHSREPSKFFTTVAKPDNLLNPQDPCEQKSKIGLQNPTTRDNKMQGQLDQADGKLGGSEVGISSDELAMPGDDYKFVKRMREKDGPPYEDRLKSASPVKQDEEPLENTGLAKSNIPSGNFRDSGGRRARPKYPLTSKSKDISFPALSIVVNRTRLKGDIEIRLAQTANSTDMKIIYEGVLYRSIPTEKLLRIQWSASSLKIRLNTAKIGNEDNRIDIEVCKEKDSATMVQMLSGLSKYEVSVISSEKMDRMFARRINEGYDNAGSTMPEPEDLDLQLMNKKKERRDEAYMQELNLKRRRTGLRMVDRLQANGDSEQRSKLSQIQLGKHDDEVEEPEPSVEPAIQKKLGSFDQVLAKLNPKPHNPHLLRSRGPQISTKPWSLERSPSFEDTFPEELRYSKKHGLGQPWKKPLVYPRDGKKKTTVEWKDLERLDEGQFLNDNLIGFYLRHLECKLFDNRPDLAAKVYWFNTYFFASLTQTAKGKKGINYEAVRKWTRNIDIFNYDYAVVPINESAHWYVGIICNLPALKRILPTSSEKSPSSQSLKQSEILEDHDDDPEKSFIIFGESKLESSEGSGKDGETSTEKPVEQDTAESFAEMQLDDILDEDALSKSKSAFIPSGEHIAEDQGSSQLKAQSESYNLEKQTIPDIYNISSPSIGNTSSQRKSKRKSNLPVRTWDPDQPTIITLDSLGLPHSPTIRILKEYLHAEANDKRGGMQWEDGQVKGMTAKHIPLQNNFCDCGLFLLGYMDKFIEDPRDFIVKILRNQYDEERDWPKLNADRMRDDIRGLIQGLHADQQAGKHQNTLSKVGKTVEQRDQSKPEDKAEDLSNVRVKATNGATTTNEALKPTGAIPLRSDKEAMTTVLEANDPLAGHDTSKEAPVEEQSSINGTEQYVPHEPSAANRSSVVIVDSQPESIIDSATNAEGGKEPKLPVHSDLNHLTTNPAQSLSFEQREIPSSISSSPVKKDKAEETVMLPKENSRTTIDLSDS